MVRKNIYLRDAGVLLHRNKQNFLKRLFRCVDLARSNEINIQVTLMYESITENSQEVVAFFGDELSRFDKLLIHLHSDYSNKFGRNRYTKEALFAIKNMLQEAKNVQGFCLHPDLVDDFSVLEELIVDDEYVGIEVLDGSVCFGNRFDEINRILQEHEFLKLVLDCAHVKEMEKNGEPNLAFYVDHFGEKIKEIHISQPGNHYDPNMMDGMFNTCHSLFSTNNGDAEMLTGLRLPKNINYIIEGVVPCGKYGEELLRKEAQALKARF